VINNSIYILKANLPAENEKAIEYANMIASQVQRSNKIISDLLNFARDPLADKTNLKVPDLIDLVLAHFPPPENVTIETRTSQGLPEIYVDQQQIEQVIINILNNACQAMPQGGKISISSVEKKQDILISITDNGPGIDAKDKRKLFTPLFTTKARGIGLGLAVSKKFIEANGGRIDVQSKPGQGSTFTIVLPTARSEHGK